jgi:DNA-binding NarL/FixJ family response regulator
MKKIRILIADDHKMFRDGLKEILNKEKNILLVDEAENGFEVLEKTEKKKFDVVLMDIDMGGTNGVKATKELLTKLPSTKVLVLSMYSDSKYIMSMLEAGAKGYILKNAGKEEVIAAVNAVASGNSYFSSQVSSKIIENLYSKKSVRKRIKQRETPLTPRELEVLRLIALEYSNSEIAEELFISIRTVETHKRNLLEKLGLKNTAGLVKYAITYKIID